MNENITEWLRRLSKTECAVVRRVVYNKVPSDWYEYAIEHEDYWLQKDGPERRSELKRNASLQRHDVETRFGSEIVETLFHSFDFADEDVRALVTANLPDSIQVPSSDLLSTHSAVAIISSTSGEFDKKTDVVDFAVAGAFSMGLLTHLQSAITPLGINVPPPEVNISHGSVQLGFNGGLLALALGIAAAATTGVFPMAYAVPAGITSGLAGVFDLYLNWKKRAGEIEKNRIEVKKMVAEEELIRAQTEIAKAEAQLVRTQNTEILKALVPAIFQESRSSLEAAAKAYEEQAKYLRSLADQGNFSEPRSFELREMDHYLRLLTDDRVKKPSEPKLRSTSLPAACNELDLNIIKEVAAAYNMPTWVACHLLNRMLPPIAEMSILGSVRLRVDS